MWPTKNNAERRPLLASLVWAIALPCLAGIFSGLVRAESLDPAAALREALTVLEHQERLLQNYDIEYHRNIGAGASGNGAGTGEVGRREKRSGDRFRVDSQRSVSNGNETLSTTDSASFDGAEHRTIQPDGDATISHSAPESNSYFEVVYLRRDFVAFLKEHSAEVDLQWETLGGRRALKCSVPGKTLSGMGYHETWTWWLDPDVSWQPRQVEAMTVNDGSAFPDGRLGDSIRVIVRRFVRSAGAIVPSDVERTYSVVDRMGRTEFGGVEHLTLTAFDGQPAFDSESFTIPFVDGTQVFDLDRRVAYVVGVPGSERRLSPVQPESAILAASGARWFWWSDSRVWWGLCCALLSMLGWVSWRERRAPKV